MSAAASPVPIIAIAACTQCAREQRVDADHGKVARGQSCVACGASLAASRVAMVRADPENYPACQDRAKRASNAGVKELAVEVANHPELTRNALNSFMDELLSETDWTPIPLYAKLQIAAIVTRIKPEDMR